MGGRSFSILLVSSGFGGCCEALMAREDHQRPGHRPLGVPPLGQLGATAHPCPATRASPSTPNRARFTASASKAKSAPTLV